MGSKPKSIPKLNPIEVTAAVTAVGSALSKNRTIEEIKQASVEQLRQVEGMNLPAARKVYVYFHEQMDEGNDC